MVRVCHMTSAHSSQDVRILKKQCTSLAKKYETYLVAQGDSYIENNVNVIGIGNIVGGRFKRMTHATRLVYKNALELDCDIYQIHDPELLPYAKKLKKRGKRVIFDSHEDYVSQIREKSYIPKLFRTVISSLFEHYQNSVMGIIDGVIFPCYKDGKHIFENKCNFVATVGNEPKLEELYNKYSPDSKKISRSICHIGSLSYNRGIDHFARAATKVNAVAILGGSFRPAEFKDKILNSSPKSNIDYRGICDRDDVLKIYKESLIGNCTILNVGQYNTYDNFATKIYEYMSMGLPVIMSDYTYAQKINNEYNFAILVSPDNVDEIADAIEYLINNPSNAIRMGENGRRAIKEKFNWDIEEKKLLNLYEKILVI